MSSTVPVPQMELNEKIAKLCKFDQFVIIKRGLYYRPKAGGYTSCLSEAWKLPKVEAKKYEMYADRADIPGNEKVLIESAPIPDYCNDLNAMHDVEGMMGLDRCDNFERHLRAIVGRDLLDSSKRAEKVADLFYWHANGSQRAEAFIATMEASSLEQEGTVSV